MTTDTELLELAKRADLPSGEWLKRHALELAEVDAAYVIAASPSRIISLVESKQALEEGVERLRVALKDCADDLEAEILARANSELPRRIDRDLETVRVARQALSPNNPAGQAMEGDHG